MGVKEGWWGEKKEAQIYMTGGDAKTENLPSEEKSQCKSPPSTHILDYNKIKRQITA